MSTYVVGDIHGGLKGLKQVLDLAPISQGDQLIFLGDYVDGWSESAQVIEYLMTLEQEYNCVFIKGNHDIWVEEWIRSGSTNHIWLKHGGKESIYSYKQIDVEDYHKHLTFFEKMPLYHIDSENRLFIHAGFTSMHGPQKEFHTSNYNWDRTLWEVALAMNENLPIDSKYYPERLKLFKEIYIGHTPTTRYDEDKPMNAVNVWNIDTGAAFKGKISIMDIDTKAFWQSDPVYKLYPRELGRNKNQ